MDNAVRKVLGSSSGLGHRPLTAGTWVRLPYRVPTTTAPLRGAVVVFGQNGMGGEGNVPKRSGGEKASCGRFFSSPGWRRHCPSAVGDSHTGYQQQQHRFAVLLLFLDKTVWEAKGTCRSAAEVKKRPVDGFSVPRAGDGTVPVPSATPIPGTNNNSTAKRCCCCFWTKRYGRRRERAEAQRR